MIITCPNCQTRYQVASDTIGSAGRKVQCANCQIAWQATPEFPKATPKPRIVSSQRPAEAEDDRLFGAGDEKGLDEAFAAEEQMLAAQAEARDAAELYKEAAVTTPPRATGFRSDPGLTPTQQKAFSKRRDDLISSLPYAKVRRTLRLVGAAGLVCLVAGGFFWRTDIVRQFPNLAGIYESVGLGVNVIGLEFRDVKTLLALKNGGNVMIIDAKIASVNPRRTDVPQVVVTLMGETGEALYEWSVTPDVSYLAPGEVVEFQTQLASPPAGASRVKLTFINGRKQSDKPVAAVADKPVTAVAEPGAH